MGGVNVPNLAAMEQTRMLAHTLAQNEDPKFQVHNVNLEYFTYLLPLSLHLSFGVIKNAIFDRALGWDAI